MIGSFFNLFDYKDHSAKLAYQLTLPVNDFFKERRMPPQFTTVSYLSQGVSCFLAFTESTYNQLNLVQ
ncbi:MAG TPA: hypothetical protein DDW65_22505 [Firmicutes bacterium]|nr:hypothetical protein [Bacillota bacterium]